MENIFANSLRHSQPLACRLLEAAVVRGRLANAYLLEGRSRADKQALSLQLACYLNCSKAKVDSGSSCLVAGLPESQFCLNCQWIVSGQHPQAWLCLSGQGRSQKIPVEKVRQLSEELARTSSFVRVVLIPEAGQEIFHRPAANALLKNIEEPPDNCLFILFCDSTDEVLPTVVSRCQVVRVATPLKSGHWTDLPSHAPASGKLAAEELLAAFRADLLEGSKRARKKNDGGGSVPFHCSVEEALCLSGKLMQLSQQLEELLSDEEQLARILDLVVACEVEALSSKSSSSAAVTTYLSSLLELAEGAKQQINHFVKPTSVLETFSFALSELRHRYSGGISLAKHY